MSTYSGVVTVDNVAPTATFNAPDAVNEGSAIALSLTDTTDPSSADTTAGFEYAFDCGTGSGFGGFSTTSTATCSTNDNGTRTVGAKIRDKDGGVTEYSASVTIANVAPSATFEAPSAVDEGSGIDLALTGPTDPSSVDTAAGFEYAFDCGSGFGGFGTTSTATCSTNDNGTRTVGAKIRDKDGAVTEYGTTVTIDNVAPSATFTAGSPVNEGSDIALSLGSATDPSTVDTAAGFEFAFDCGSGFGGFGATSTATCSTNDNGTRTVGAKIRDKDGGTNTYTATVTINNVAPSATFTANSPVNEGSDIGLSFSSAIRPVKRRHHRRIRICLRLRHRRRLRRLQHDEHRHLRDERQRHPRRRRQDPRQGRRRDRVRRDRLDRQRRTNGNLRRAGLGRRGQPDRPLAHRSVGSVERGHCCRVRLCLRLR